MKPRDEVILEAHIAVPLETDRPNLNILKKYLHIGGGNKLVLVKIGTVANNNKTFRIPFQSYQQQTIMQRLSVVLFLFVASSCAHMCLFSPHQVILVVTSQTVY